MGARGLAMALPRSGSTTPKLNAGPFFFFFEDTGGRFVSRNVFNRSGTPCSAMALMFSSACSAELKAIKAFSLQMRLKASASAMAAWSSGEGHTVELNHIKERVARRGLVEHVEGRACSSCARAAAVPGARCLESLQACGAGRLFCTSKNVREEGQ